MFARLSKLPLRLILTIFLLPFLILILISCTVFYFSSTSQYAKLLKANAQSLVLQTQRSLDNDLANVKTLSESLTASPAFYTMKGNISADSDAISPVSYLQLSNTFTDFLQQNSSHIASIGLFLSDRSIYYYRTNPDFKATIRPDFQYARSLQDGIALDWFYNAKEFPYQSVPENSQFSLLEPLGTQQTKVNGFFLVGINDNLFLDQIKNTRLTKNSCMTLIRDDGEILFRDSGQLNPNPIKQMDQREIAVITNHIHSARSKRLIAFQTSEYYVVYTPVSIPDTGILAVIPLREMMTDYRSFSNLLLVFALAAISIFVILYHFIPLFFSRPVVHLLRQMDQISSPDIKEPIQVYGSSEIVRLGESVNALLARINTLTKSIELEMRAKQTTQLQYLFAQINPHFLYNSLDCIKELCACKETEKAEEMVDQLAVFYRIGVSGGKSFISLHDEFLHVSMYLSILRTRYEDFEFTLQLPQALENCVVLRMILQPVVENAVYHGLRPYRTDGHVRVVAERKGTELVLHVIDNGAGITEDAFEKIQQSLHAPICDYSRQSFSVYGLKNVQDRLQITYGKDCGIQIQTEIDVGTHVTLTVPYEEERT